jgi:hypothetical protein
MEAILADAAKREPEQSAQLSGNFSEAMKDQLDNLFGNL